MANMKKHGLKRLLAFLLLAVCLCGVFPSQAFAASVGQKASSWLGGAYVGSDGRHYTSPAPYTYLAYQKDGTVDVHTSSGGTDYRHYMLTDSDGVTHPVFCVESGISFLTGCLVDRITPIGKLPGRSESVFIRGEQVPLGLLCRLIAACGF